MPAFDLERPASHLNLFDQPVREFFSSLLIFAMFICSPLRFCNLYPKRLSLRVFDLFFSSILTKHVSVVSNVIANEGGNKIIAMIIARLHAQLKGLSFFKADLLKI